MAYINFATLVMTCAEAVQVSSATRPYGIRLIWKIHLLLGQGLDVGMLMSFVSTHFDIIKVVLH
jgi:hypothetical protein